MSKKYHFIGIGGVGMSGLAKLALDQAIEVSGSDVASSHVTENLSLVGSRIFIGHSATHIQSDMTVIYSTDIKKDNPEYAAAVDLKCPLLHRSELLQAMMASYQSLAVAGTHGKTTTSALLAWVLECCGESPTYAIGGIIPQFSSNSGKGSGKYFVAEACESDGSFLNYAPFGAIVTNIDLDHMDFFVNEAALNEAFSAFMHKVKHHLFWCGEDSRLQKLNPKGKSYGFSEGCHLRASNFRQNEWSLSLDACWEGKWYKNIEAALVGRHNALNVLAVFGLALSLGLEEKKVREAFKSFGGVLRRCEKKGEMHGILFLDDYAHHPTELQATLKAIRQAVGERRLIVAYQPHRYTRTKDCEGMYGEVFNEADALFLTEIYAARETPIPGISHEGILAEVQRKLKSRCRHSPRKKIAHELASFLRPHDVLVTFGAGDITKLSDEIRFELSLKAPPKLKLGLIYGGVSVEHEISLISSANIEAALNSNYYELEQFGISRQGAWIHGHEARISLETKQEVQWTPKTSSAALLEMLKCDILFPVLHGTLGEDGTIQGFFDLFSKAYVGCNHRASAICMDKALTKRLILDAGLPALPYVSFNLGEWKDSEDKIVYEINEKLIYPVFVKPVHLGSSIGIYKVNSAEELDAAIQAAFLYDDRLIVENGLENMREIEFSVLGNDSVTVFPPGEIYLMGNMHDYDSKYGLNPSKPAAAFNVKVNLPEEKIAEGMALAKAAYQTLGCCGMARIDTFLDKENRFWFNEINPIPGFTNYSLFPLMCEANGLNLTDLIDRLVVLGLQRRRQICSQAETSEKLAKP